MGAIQRLKREVFRARAYETAAQALRAHPDAIVSGAQARAIEGIGSGIAAKIDALLATGELPQLEKLKRDDDVIALRDLRSVHGIGAVKAAELVGRGIRSLAQLRDEVAAGRVWLDSAQTIGLRYVEELRVRIPRAEMDEHAELIEKVRLASHPTLSLMICGSYRRQRPDCGDIDVLVTPAPSASSASAGGRGAGGGGTLRDLINSLRVAGYLSDDLASGTSKYMGVCRLPGAGRQHRRIDVRFVRRDQFHYGTLYFTGSAALSVRLRLRAIELGLRLSEYGLQNVETKESILANSERGIFEALGVPYLEPWER